MDFGPDSAVPVRALQMEWFDQWLMGKDTPLVSAAAGEDFRDGRQPVAGRARVAAGAGARAQSFYLESDGHANTLAGDGALERRSRRGSAVAGPLSSSIRATPRPRAAARCAAIRKSSRGGRWTSARWSSAATCWSTPARPLKQDVEVIGPVKVVLYVATSAARHGLHRQAGGRVPGRLRAQPDRRHPAPALPRLAGEARAGATPAEVYQITVDAGVTGNVFLKGHRIRVEISSSNFPRFDRNPNTGGR